MVVLPSSSSKGLFSAPSLVSDGLGLAPHEVEANAMSNRAMESLDTGLTVVGGPPIWCAHGSRIAGGVTPTRGGRLVLPVGRPVG